MRLKTLLKILRPFIWLTLLTGALVSTSMHLGFIPGDWGPFHEYVKGFYTRLDAYVVEVILLELLTYLGLFKLLGISKKQAFYFNFWLYCVMFWDAIGNMFGWYAVNEDYKILWYDNFSHVAGAFFITLTCYVFVNANLEKFKVPKAWIALLAALMAFGFGTFYGVYEYLSDKWVGSVMVGGVEDAISDNLWDMVGAFLGFATILISSKLIPESQRE